MSSKGYVYLASPYSHERAEVREERFREAQRASAWLFVKGIWVISPIAHWHDITERFVLPTDALSYKGCNDALQLGAIATYVLAIEGWEKSSGVLGEIDLTRQIKQELLWLWPRGERYELSVEEAAPLQGRWP